MRKISICAVALATLGLAACGYTPEQRATTGAGIGANTRPPPPPRPVYYVPAPPPHGRRCVEWGEDIYGRRFCGRYYGY